MKLGTLAFVALVAACGHRDDAPAGNAANKVASAPSAPATKLRFIGCTAAAESAGFRASGAGGIYGSLVDDAGHPGFGTPGHIGAGGGPMHGHRPPMPTIAIGQPPATGDLGKTIIRRFVRRNIQKIQYCYEKELLAKPKLAGTVMTHFFITPSGTVTSAEATGMDPAVASCVATVIRGIAFPKPKGGGGVQVNYPFTFRSADDATGSTAAPPAPPKPAADPWTPFAPRLATAEPEIVAATTKEFEPRLASVEACLPVGRTGALRAMFRIHADGVVTTRVGGIGDSAIESCVTRALAGFAVAPAPSRDVEVACDVVRGDDPSWHVTPGAPYTDVEISKTTLHVGSDRWQFADLVGGGSAATADGDAARQQAIEAARQAGILGVPALGPSFAPDDDHSMFLAIVDPDVPLANLAYVLDRMANSGASAIVAVREPTGAPRFAFAADYGDYFPGAPDGRDLALRLAAHHLDVCSPALAVPSAASSDPAAVDAALAAGITTCADKKCAAADVLAARDATAAELLAVTARIRRAGIDVIRFMPQPATCVQPGSRAGSGSGSATPP